MTGGHDELLSRVTRAYVVRRGVRDPAHAGANRDLHLLAAHVVISHLSLRVCCLLEAEREVDQRVVVEVDHVVIVEVPIYPAGAGLMKPKSVRALSRRSRRCH